ncbi:MAG: hypothetical protein ACTSRG_10525 [Candidatus Helarchaeota archaeon]
MKTVRKIILLSILLNLTGITFVASYMNQMPMSNSILGRSPVNSNIDNNGVTKVIYVYSDNLTKAKSSKIILESNGISVDTINRSEITSGSFNN